MYELLKFVSREFVDGTDVLNSGVVDEDVNFSERLNRVGYHCRNLRNIGEVATLENSIYTVTFTEALAKILNIFALTETVEHDITTFFGKSGCYRVSDATGCTRYNR